MALSKVENPFTGQIIPVEFTGDEPTQQELASLYNFLNQSNEQSNTPLTKEEFIDKRKYDQTKSTFQTVKEFGEGVVEGAGEIVKQGGEALDELPPGYQMILAPNYDKFFDAIGDIVDLGGRDFVRFAKTLGGAAMDKLGGYSEEEEIDREYKRYIENFDYHTKVRPAMLASDEIEFKKIVNFGANFVDPFLAFPVAKLGTMAVRAPLVALQKGATKGAYATRSKGLVGTSRFLQKTGKAVGGVDKGVEIIGKIGAYPSEMAARAGAYATRKAVKGTALGAGLALQGIGKLGAGVEKVASAPRKAVTAMAGKLRNIGEGAPSAAALSSQVTGAISGVPGFLEVGIAEGIGILAKKVGGGTGQLLRILAEPASNKRFLYRVATSEKVSPQMRKAAMFAYSNYGTSLGDGAFNMLANGLSIGAINSALAGLSGEDARTAGAGFGAGAVIGGALPFGQRGMRAGKRDVARDDKSIDSHMANKLTSLQRESFLKLPKPAQVMLATLEEAGVGAPKVMIVEPKLYLEMLNKDRVEKGMEPLNRAPKGHFQKADRTIFINEKFLPRGSKEATEIAAHEVGHDFIYQALGEDPGMLELILDKYKTTADKGTPYYFKFGPSRKATAEDVGNGVATREGQVIPGEPIGDPIYLSDEAVQIATDYDRIQRGISVGRDAGKLAQEIGADQFAMMFSKDPNAFNNFHPRLRRHLIYSARKVLASIGVVKPDTGNPLSNPISKTMLKNPSIQRLFDNYGKARGIELDEKANLAKDSVTIQPKKGQSGEDRYTELFGGQGLSLRDARNLIVSNKSLIRQVKSIMKMYKDEPRDTWSVTKNGKFTGKNLLQDLRTIFTRNDPFGNVANILDALQEAINQRIGVRFGYRSGTKGKYQNPFKIRDVALYAWEVSGFGGGRPSLKVLGYNQAVVRSNIQVLVEKGYIKDPNQFMLDLEKQGQRALEDPEGRINPEGRDENVLMTVAFGLKESAPNIKSEGLRDLLESKAVKKSFVSYDVEALAGLTKGKDKAFAFNYSNIRDNYNPFRQADENFYIPTGEADVSNILQAIRENDDGFTMDLKARFAKAGFVVAPSKATEFVINQNKLDSETLRGYLETHAEMFEREGAHLGGWLKKPTGEYMLDVVFPLSYEDAVRHAMWGDQDAIFDLSTFNEIATRNETTKKVQPPEGFPESAEQILRQKPSDLGAAAEGSFRDSSPIRNESIESIRRRAEGSQSEVREPPPSQARGEEIDPNLFLPEGFHGTPHTFDPEPGAPLGRFRSDKIGTGEGNQAFGHGLYFASRQDVAEHYQNMERRFFDGRPFDRNNVKHEAADLLSNWKDRAELVEYLGRKLKIEPSEKNSQLLEIVKNQQEAKETKTSKGSLYKVEIAPKDSEFLLWDEYIKNQPKGVRKKLQKVIDRYEMKGLEDRTLGEFYELLGVRLEIKDDLGFGSGYPAASAALKEVGIPGIRYKDRRSFIKDDSDVFNYVVFDEADVQITDKLFMPALEDAKALVEQRGRVAEAAEETFFGKMLPKMLRKVGGQLKPSTRNIREAARRAIEDTEVFLKENPQFADYYNADMEKVRSLLDSAYNGIIDDEMLYYRLTLGLTSPGTSLPANVGDGLNIFNLKKQDGNLDKIKLGESEKGNVVVEESPFQISGLTAPTKAKALKIVDRLEKEKGGIRQAVEFLEEGIPMKELHKFKLEMGFKGRVGKVGDIQRIVKAATGQDKLIPRMFIFGPKVGAYTLNAIGRHNYNTIDVWEARFIRSYFRGMFSKNTGLPANVDEHALMTRFTEMFQEEYNRMTGQNLETSALQALRWFYMIDTAKKLGYTGASTNETISGYTERYLTRLGLDQGSGGQSNATTDGGVSAQAGPTEQQFLPQPRQLNRVTSRPASPQVSNRFMMMPAAARAAVASGQTLDRFRN